jgi:SnoaL-like protein
MECGVVQDEWALASVRDGVTAWNRRDWSAFETLHTRGVLYESPHAHVVGRTAVTQKFQELVRIVPDLHSSELRLVENFAANHRATFEYVQTGTLLDVERGVASRFEVATTLFVRFDDHGRVSALRTIHR